ncbi:MAG: hypothetical protein KJ771_00035 [Nanoarchaeota archaeon]|nr:hypothetical protein [Nanoarchaeota archaeon]
MHKIYGSVSVPEKVIKILDLTSRLREVREANLDGACKAESLNRCSATRPKGECNVASEAQSFDFFLPVQEARAKPYLFILFLLKFAPSRKNQNFAEHRDYPKCFKSEGH